MKLPGTDERYEDEQHQGRYLPRKRQRMAFGYCGFADDLHANRWCSRKMRLGCGGRPENRWSIDVLDLRKETVAAARYCFHKSGALGGVAERFADLVDGFIEPVVEIHKGVCSPEFLLQVLATHYLASVLD